MPVRRRRTWCAIWSSDMSPARFVILNVMISMTIRVARPMLCHVSGRTNLIWPQTTFYDITLDAGKRIYAQIAPEPNYRWKEYCSQSLAIADELDVNRIITLGSMFSDCPHTRPLPIAVSDGDCQCEGDRSYNGRWAFLLFWM